MGRLTCSYEGSERNVRELRAVSNNAVGGKQQTCVRVVGDQSQSSCALWLATLQKVLAAALEIIVVATRIIMPPLHPMLPPKLGILTLYYKSCHAEDCVE